MIEFQIQKTDVLLPAYSMTQIDPEYEERDMVIFAGKMGGISVWGEYFEGELELNVGKYKGLNELMCPKIWNYCKEICEQL